MKTPRFVALSTTLLFLPLTSYSAEDRPIQSAAYQAGVEQEQLRAQTSRLIAEISAMLEQFRQNPAAAAEVALTETTLKSLQNLSDKDMAAVILAMQEISKTPKSTDATSRIVNASKTAKDVQLNLARLADKLALYQDEASMDLRLTALLRRQLANQRQAHYLAQGIISNSEQAKETELTAVEQKAIAEESNDLLLSLQRLAANPASSGQTAFIAAYKAGVAGTLLPNSQSAATVAAAKDFAGTQTAQQKVIASLQAMLLALSADKSLEERFRDAEQNMRTLASREQTLSRTTAKAGIAHLRSLTRQQQEIADQRTILELGVLTLSADTAPLLGQTRQGLETLDDTFQKNPQVMNRPNEKTGIVSSQNDVASQFLAIADLLKKHGDAVAKANSSSQGKSDEDAKREAMTSAANSLVDAISKMDLSQQILGQGDSEKAKEEMTKAQGDLTKAQSTLGNGSNSTPQNSEKSSSSQDQGNTGSQDQEKTVSQDPGKSSSSQSPGEKSTSQDPGKNTTSKGPGENIKKAQDGLSKGQRQASQGGGEDRRDANKSVEGAKSAAIQALADLKNALNAMNSQGQLVGGGKLNEAENPASGSGAGWGGLFHHTSDNSAYSAVAKITSRDRDALATLQKETAPPEYDTQARQYMKNLADGVVPAQ